MFTFLPVETYSIETPLDIDDVVRRLTAQTRPSRLLEWRRSRSEFVGMIRTDRSTVHFCVRNQTSFAPEIHGTISGCNGGTNIRVQAIPSGSALTLVAILSGGLIELVFYRGAWVYPVIMGNLALCWLLAMGGFWIDRGRSRARLLALFKA